MRMVPDVAFNAAANSNATFIVCPGYTPQNGTCGINGTNDNTGAIGGTSASAPAFAGVVALLTQAAGGGRLGNINPLLYQLSASAPSGFHDIVNGNNEVMCTPGQDTGCPTGGLMGFPATAGYDCATGLGSLDVFNLATTWAGLAPTTISLGLVPTSTNPGGTVGMTATVDVTKPNASPLGGTVRFAFQSYAGGPPDAGSADLSWTLGTDAVTPGTPATNGGTATFSGAVPVGLVDPAAQYVDVVAMYGGDAHHLASTSAKVRLTFQNASSFCLVPSYGTIQPEEGFTFSYTGGTPPVQWYVSVDSTCDQNDNNCSTLDQNSGAFRAGIEPGYVEVVGIDANGVEQVANFVVGDPGDAGGEPPWGDAEAPFGGCNAPPPDAGFTIGAPEAGVDASGPIVDSGTTVIVDSGTGSTDASVAADGGVVTPVDAASDAPIADASDDAGTPGGTVKSGCGCKVVAGGSSAPAGALAGIGLGLGALVRRRRRNPASR